MIVVDASAFVEWMTDASGRSHAIAEALAADSHWVVPEHFLLEVTNAFRGLWLAGRLGDDSFDSLLERLEGYELEVWPTRTLLPRIRQLAQNATAYDGAYLALAEILRSPLLTVDAKLAQVPGIQCRVIQS